MRFPLLPVLLLAAATTAPVSTAQSDRTDTTPTDWYHLGNVTSSTIRSRISAGFRLIDIEIQSVSPRRYAATFVRNSGAYSRAWWWFTQITGPNLGAFVSQNNARLIDLAPYELNGSTYFAAILVRNTGAQRKTWWWYYNTDPSTIRSRFQANGARLVNLERYRVAGQVRYAAIMIRNAGADRRAWAYYINATAQFIGDRIRNDNMRLVDLDRRSSTRFNCLMVRESGPWWWFLGQSLAEIDRQADQIGARVVDIEPRVTSGGTTYDAILTNNSNALTTRLSAAIRSATDGASGFYLERIGGPVLASLQASYRHDPASVLKTVQHAWAMRQVSTGSLNLNAPITVFRGNGPGSCPSTLFDPVSERLEVVLQRMMRNSDNTRARAITDLAGGLSALSSFASGRGMTATRFNHHIGCGTPANVTTLVDLGTLHERIANGFLGSARDDFYEIMNSWSSGGGFDRMIDQEAARLGLSSSVTARFKREVEFRRKGGNYGWPGIPRFHRGSFGWARVPFFTASGQRQHREYVAGVFVNDATNGSNARNAVSTIMAEILREEVRAALDTWRSHVFGSFEFYGPSCRGTVGSPVHFAEGTPEIGELLRFRLRRVRAFANVVFNVGLDRIGLDLAAIGAPGCELLTTPMITQTAIANASGDVSRPLRIPTDRALIGAGFSSQFAAFDLGANPLGLVTSSAVRVTLGGQR